MACCLSFLKGHECRHGPHVTSLRRSHERCDAIPVCRVEELQYGALAGFTSKCVCSISIIIFLSLSERCLLAVSMLPLMAARMSEVHDGLYLDARERNNEMAFLDVACGLEGLCLLRSRELSEVWTDCLSASLRLATLFLALREATSEDKASTLPFKATMASPRAPVLVPATVSASSNDTTRSLSVLVNEIDGLNSSASSPAAGRFFGSRTKILSRIVLVESSSTALRSELHPLVKTSSGLPVFESSASSK